MTMWNSGAKTFPLGRASAQPSHICFHPCFVDEDELFGIEVQLPFEPFLSPLGDIGAILLAGVRGLLWNGPPLPPAE